MTELQLYGIDGLFHNIVKQSAVMNGRYAVLPKGGADLNANNVISGLELPTVGSTYPGVFFTPPVSEISGTIQQSVWECFYCRGFFLCTTNYTGDNKIKSPDKLTNTSLHTVPMDWSDMKLVCLGFMNALEKIQKKLLKDFHLKQGRPWRITRLSNVQNANLSGVMIQFECEISSPCLYEDINMDGITTDQLPHYH